VLTYDEDAEGARFAFTDRYGGVSTGPYAELNLGGHVGDDAAAVVTNRHRVAERIGMPAGQVLYMNQVHGADVAVVDGPWEGRAPDVDAMITSRPGVVLAVLVADCVPVLLADRTAGVVGVAHAGRPGLAAGVDPGWHARARRRRDPGQDRSIGVRALLRGSRRHARRGSGAGSAVVGRHARGDSGPGRCRGGRGTAA
jgi:copper oxidase (laccase) domain-containing protein